MHIGKLRRSCNYFGLSDHSAVIHQQEGRCLVKQLRDQDKHYSPGQATGAQTSILNRAIVRL